MKLTKYFTVFTLAVFAALPAVANVSDDTLRMTEDVRKRIVTLSDYGVFDNIAYSIDGSTVTLHGEASRPSLQKSAERVVSRVKGVEEVVNEIEVLPNSRHDERIRAEAYQKIYGHPTLSRYSPNHGIPPYVSMSARTFGPSVDPPMGAHPIHIVVKNGVVTLEGMVNNEADKNIAGMQANTVSGAFEVVNNLRVANS